VRLTGCLDHAKPSTVLLGSSYQNVRRLLLALIWQDSSIFVTEIFKFYDHGLQDLEDPISPALAFKNHTGYTTTKDIRSFCFPS
jgi:hypothetical protein